MVRLSATEVVRRFSELLNHVAGAEEIDVVSSGASVAPLTPPRVRLLPASRLRKLLATLPPVDAELAEDLRRIRREVGPPASRWPS